MGVLLLASITSLPELIVGMSSVFMGNHSVAVFNIFNVFIIFLMDVFILRKFIFMGEIEEGKDLAKLSLTLIVTFLAGFLMKDLSFLGQSPFVLGIIAIYLKFLKSKGGQGGRGKSSFDEIKGPLKNFMIDSKGVVLLGVVYVISLYFIL